jgi:beta-glucosidase
MYHWDLPQALEDQGGWTNRKSVEWFAEYVNFITQEFGSKVKFWMIMNEPMAFTALGYLLGIHAPGKRGIGKFCAAVHHTCLAMGEASRIARKNLPKDTKLGSTYSCTYVQPLKDKPKNAKAVVRWDAMMNRIFIEPNLGMGYPIKDIPLLKGIKKYIKPGDMEKIRMENLDFIGVQNYTRGLVRKALFPPIMWSREIPAKKRKVPMTDMGWEVYPEALYQMIKKFAAYPGVKEIIVTENGAAFPDVLESGEIHDSKRLEYIQENIKQVHRAIQEGIPCKGYIIWSFMDNFEWSFGFRPRFGLVYVDFATQKRTVKDSGKWFAKFLAGS